MSTNKSSSYLLCNKCIIVNLYKLYFPFFSFSLQPNKRVFHPPTFPSLQPNTQEGKLNIFHPPTFPSSHNFPSSHFSTPPSKQTLKLGRLLSTKIVSVSIIIVEMPQSVSSNFEPRNYSTNRRCCTKVGI